MEEKITPTLESIQNNIEEWVYNNIGRSFKFRKYQLESITYVIKSILIDKRNYQIMEAPTGSGKSLISIISAGVLAHYYDIKSYILCSDLFLWKQYSNFIDQYHLTDFGYLKGLSNYTCFINKQEVKYGKCKLDKVGYQSLKNPDWCKRHFYNCVYSCQYMKDRIKAEKAKVTLMTYQLYLHMLNLIKNGEHKTFTEREVVFCDECHNIPDIIQSFCTPTLSKNDIDRMMTIVDYAENENLEISANMLVNRAFDEEHMDSYDELVMSGVKHFNFNDLASSKSVKEKLDFIYDSIEFLNDKSPEECIGVLEDYHEVISFIDCVKDTIDEVVKSESINNKGKLESDLAKVNKALSWYSQYKEFIEAYLIAIKNTGKEYAIIEQNISEDKETTYTLSCAKEDYLCHKYLLKSSKNFVFLSATVGMHEVFDDNIGIKLTESKQSMFSRIPSTFDFTKSPIYYIPKYKMSVANKEKDFPIIKQMVYKIIAANKCRGIIHTGSYDNAIQLYSSAPKQIKDRMILYNNAKQKEEIIQTYIYKDDAVLIGPTLIEGIDLPNDLCRFNILMKVPYPNIKSKLIQKKMEVFPLWYDSTTSNDIIQGIGRGVRNENDYYYYDKK